MTTNRQNRTLLKDNCAYRQSQMNSDRYIKKSETTRHFNFSKYVRVCCLVPVNDEFEIKAKSKKQTKVSKHFFHRRCNTRRKWYCYIARTIVLENF